MLPSPPTHIFPTQTILLHKHLTLLPPPSILQHSSNLQSWSFFTSKKETISTSSTAPPSPHPMTMQPVRSVTSSTSCSASDASNTPVMNYANSGPSSPLRSRDSSTTRRPLPTPRRAPKLTLTST